RILLPEGKENALLPGQSSVFENAVKNFIANVPTRAVVLQIGNCRANRKSHSAIGFGADRMVETPIDSGPKRPKQFAGDEGNGEISKVSRFPAHAPQSRRAQSESRERRTTRSPSDRGAGCQPTTQLVAVL